MIKTSGTSILEIKRSAEALTDKPTTKDLLGYEKYTVPIAHRIAEATNENTPMSIGIYGEWGSGKTSFLKMVSEELHKSNIYPIWFNAWKYEKEDNLWSALIQTILDQAKVRGNWYERVWIKVRLWWDTISLRAGLWNLTKKLLPALLRTLIFILCVAIIFGWSSQEIQTHLSRLADRFKDVPLLSYFLQPYSIKIVSALIALFSAKPEQLIKLFDARLGIDFSKLQRKRTYQEHIAFLDEFSTEFKRIIKLIGRGKPIVVIIDDLDRCLPEKAVQVLETIKLFLDVQGCVFLLAVDKEIVEKAVSIKYKDLLAMLRESNERSSSLSTFLGENYFEKIVQTPFLLPPLSTDSIETFITSLYEDEEARQNAKTFAVGLPRNARKIKRIINIFLFLRDLAADRIEKGEIHPTLLAKLVIIQHQFRDLYRDIIDHPLLLSALESYYRNPAEAGEGRAGVDNKITLDPILKEKVAAYATQYSSLPLREILLQSNGDEDAFSRVRLEDYIYFVKTITEEKTLTPEETSEIDPKLAQGKYLAYLLGVSSELRIPSSNVTLPLDKAFVGINLTPYTTEEHQDQNEMTLDQVFKSSGRIGILGEPGTGKTTLLMHLTKTFAEAAVRNNPAEIKQLFGITDTLLPILISLHDYSTFLANRSDRTSSPSPDLLIQYLNDYFTRWNLELPQNFFTNYLEQGKCILLLDGLDEIAEMPQRIYVAECVNAIASRYPSNRFVVTIRPVGFGGQVQLFKFDYYKILSWSDEKVQAFIDRLSTLSSDPAIREQAEPLLAAIMNRKELRSLASNPLLLTLITQLYRHQSTVPIARSELYKHAVNMLLARWDIARGINRGDIDRFYLDTLSAVALKMCERQVTEVDETEIVQTLARLRGTPSNETTTIQSILKTGGGLLAEVESGRYCFITRSFQEYFAARALVNSPHPIQAALEHKDDPDWREVILFVIDSLMQGDSVKGNELLQSLLDTSNPYTVMLIGQYLTENSPFKADANFIKHVQNALGQIESDSTLKSEIRETSKIINNKISGFLEAV
jgi:Cdc6-like AAA superfamily ATPase